MDGFDLIYQENGVSFYKKDGEIKIVAHLNMKLHILDKILDIIRNDQFFCKLQELNHDVIVHHYQNTQNLSEESFLIKNLFNDDQELNLFCFKTNNKVGSSSAIINGINSDKERDTIEFLNLEDNEIEKMSFDTFSISLDPADLIFSLKYNSDTYQSCVFRIVKKYFDIIFFEFSDHILTDPSFLY